MSTGRRIPVRRTTRVLSLRVLPAANGRQRLALPPSRAARWRAAVLIGVHLLIAAHLLHWWITGRSLGRFVLSDSMQTLEVGEINPGFILFALSLVVTAVAGRFMCGWVCHMGALQDLCAWALRRLGIRPHLFRSRVLGYVPLGLAIYMFVWPTLKREVLAPIATDISPAAVAWIGSGQSFPGFSLAVTSDRMWDGLPSLWVAVPFLLMCGVATVYFLGARGLCRYGCPYGGFLLAAEQCAPIRIVVDPARCDQCGLCTAACTAGVRVHDEVRLNGAVHDRNCVRSLDCISVCPQNALSLRASRPAALARKTVAPMRSRRFDLSLWDEILVGLVFLAAFFTVRGIYGLIPMLMAATIAVLAAFGAHKLLRVALDQHVRLGPLQLRHRGALTMGGRSFIFIAVILIALFGHSAAVRVILWRAGTLDDRVTVPYAAVAAGNPVSPDQLAIAREALLWYRWSASVTRGGIALSQTPEATVRVAWLNLVLGHRDAAIEELGHLARSGRGNDHAAFEWGRLLLVRGGPAEAVGELESVIQANPTWSETRDLLCSIWIAGSESQRAFDLYRTLLSRRPLDFAARVGLSRAYWATNHREEALHEAVRAASDSPREPLARSHLAHLSFQSGKVDEALSQLESAANDRPAARRYYSTLGARMLKDVGRDVEADALERRSR